MKLPRFNPRALVGYSWRHLLGYLMATLLVVDPLLLRPLAYTGRLECDLHKTNGGRRDVVIINLLGAFNDSEAVERLALSALLSVGDVISVRYDEQTMRADELQAMIFGDTGLLNRYEAHRWRHVVILGGSLGGLMAMELLRLHSYQARLETPRRDYYLVLDNAPSGAASLKMPRPVLQVASLLRFGGPLWTWLKQPAILVNFRGLFAEADHYADPDGVRAHYRAMAAYPAAGSGAQLQLMLATDVTDGRYDDIAGHLGDRLQVLYIGDPDSSDDPMVNHRRAIDDYRHVFASLRVTDLPRRSPQAHNTLAEEPRLVVDAIKMVLTGH